MKLTVKQEKVNCKNDLLACYDVSQSDVHFVSEYKYDGKTYIVEDVIKNNPRSLKNHFLEIEEIMKNQEMKNIHIFFEPSGGYEKSLKRLAVQRGYKVSHVSSEATKNARTIESNDGSKSDSKDKCIILTLAQMSKILSCRTLPNSYSQLRILGEQYDDASNKGMVLRNKIAATVKELFQEYSVQSNFFYTALGKNIIKKFGFNPYKITAYSLSYFIKETAGYLKHVNEKKLKDIYRAALVAKLIISKEEAQLYERCLILNYEEYEAVINLKSELKTKMISIYRRLPEYSKLSQISKISEFQISRVIAETGPLSDFSVLKQLMRYAGLNIKVKESGKYKGNSKISKKGRPLLRKVLYQIVFSSMMKKGQYYYEYYKEKKDHGAKGLVVMVNIMRKVLRLIFGVFNSCMIFDRKRIHVPYMEYVANMKSA